MSKYLSRKFIISLAAFLGSIGASIAGITSKSDTVAVFGVICATLSAAIYAAAEAKVDAANSTSTTYEITKGTTVATSTTKATNTQLQKDLIAEAQMKAAETGIGDQDE